MARGRQRHFSGDFKQNPDLDSSSQIVSVIQCLQTSSQGTNLESPIQDDSFGRPSGMNHLLTAGRPGVKKGIILLSDGEANQPYANTSCEYAFDMALRAKNAAIEVFTIGSESRMATTHSVVTAALLTGVFRSLSCWPT